MVMSVYKTSRQFNSVGNLKKVLIRCWKNTDEYVLHRLNNGMTKPHVNVLRMHGSKIKH